MEWLAAGQLALHQDRMMKGRMMFGRERLIRMILGVSGTE